MSIKNLDEKMLAKKIIVNNLKIEESLARLLSSQTKLLKRKSYIDINSDEIKEINMTIKYLIYYFVIIDDRIQKCIEIIQNNKDNNNNA